MTEVFLGPVNLSVPEVRRALLTMVEKVRRASIPVGALGLDPAFVRELFAHGPDFLAHGIDTMIDQKYREIQQAVFGPEA